MITQDQNYKILEKLAYLFGEICEHNNFKTTSEYNWKKAEQIFNLEIKINGEEWLLSLIEDDNEN